MRDDLLGLWDLLLRNVSDPSDRIALEGAMRSARHDLDTSDFEGRLNEIETWVKD
jgi:hypothetical protein